MCPDDVAIICDFIYDPFIYKFRFMDSTNENDI